MIGQKELGETYTMLLRKPIDKRFKSVVITVPADDEQYEWIAELKKQNLGLRVPDDIPGSLDNTYEFVSLADNPMD